MLGFQYQPLAPNTVRKRDAITVPNFAAGLQDALKQIQFRQPTDNSQAIQQIGLKRTQIAGMAPNQFDTQALQNKSLLAETQSRQKFLQGNMVPQRQATPFVPLPTRQDVPLPNAMDRTNETAARGVGGILAAFGGRADLGSVLPNLTREGKERDQNAYQNALTNYQFAVDKANQQYTDQMNARQAEVTYKQQEEEANFQNAMARYGQLDALNQVEGKAAGLEANTQGLNSLSTRTQEAAQGAAQLESDLALLEEKARVDAATNQAFQAILKMSMEAEQLRQSGMVAEADIVAKEAMAEVHRATATNIQQETSQNAELFPIKKQGAQQDVNNKIKEGRILDKQPGLIDAQIGQYNAQSAMSRAHARAYEQQAKAEVAAIPAGQFNVARQNAEFEIRPYREAVTKLRSEFTAIQKQRLDARTSLGMALNGTDTDKSRAAKKTLEPLDRAYAQKAQELQDAEQAFAQVKADQDFFLQEIFKQSPLMQGRGTATTRKQPAPPKPKVTPGMQTKSGGKILGYAPSKQ